MYIFFIILLGVFIMRILDKYKDYYDYLTGAYGIDNTVFYDRRSSVKLTQDTLIRQLFLRGVYYNYFEDIKEKDVSSPLYSKYYNEVILEVGYFQYLLTLEKLKKDTMVKSSLGREYDVCTYNGEIKIAYRYDNHKHYLPAPISLFRINSKYDISYAYRKKDNEYFSKLKIEPDEENAIANPILYNTSIPSLIDPKTIYIEVADFIASKADVDIVDNRDDVAKAVDHGFDKKTSFRRM